MNAVQVKDMMEEAAGDVLDARRRIELAVDEGLLPTWVLEACEQWERAAMTYGAGMVQREMRKQAVPAPELASATVH
tara:strand:- start:6898 stop:7128 length:231 start_codon:yes stop_codon:yes gene_type:complete